MKWLLRWEFVFVPACHIGRKSLPSSIPSWQEETVQQTLQQPSEIPRSQSDANVYLYYKPDPPYFTCVVARHLNGEGFIITTYRTNRIKIGDFIWTA